MDILPAYIFGVPHACLVLKEAKRGPEIPQNLSSELEIQEMAMLAKTSIVMGVREPDPCNFCKQVKPKVEGQGHQPSPQTFNLPAECSGTGA